MPKPLSKVCEIDTASYWIAVDPNKHVARPVLGPSLGEAEARWEQHMVLHAGGTADEVRSYVKRHIRFYPIAEPIT